MITAMETHQRLEGRRDPESAVDGRLVRSGVDKHPFHPPGLSGCDRHAAERFKDGAADTGLGLDIQASYESVDDDVDTGRVGGVARADERLAERGGGFGADFRQGMFQKRKDVGDQGWPFETSEGADRHACCLRIVAAGSGSNHREVARRGRTAILGFEHGKVRDWRLRRNEGHKGYKGHKGECCAA